MGKRDILRRYPPLVENVLLILHEFQDSNPQHYLDKDDMAMIAEYLNVPYSAIYGVVSYYTMFSLKPRGKHVIRVCCSPVCQMADSNVALATLRNNLGIDIGATTADGVFTLETAECLGQCDTAPGMSIDDQYYGNLSEGGIEPIIENFRTKR